MRSSPRWRRSTRPTTRCRPTSAWPRPRADQKIVQSKRAVEIETLKAHAEVEPLVALAEQLTDG
jgi:methylphosphotriester-DNA--protein-cysteine methyltransferase